MHKSLSTRLGSREEYTYLKEEASNTFSESKSRFWWFSNEVQRCGPPSTSSSAVWKQQHVQIVLSLLVITLIYLYYTSFTPAPPSIPISSPGVEHKEWCTEMSKLLPFDKSIKHLVQLPSYPDCRNTYPLYFNSTLEGTVVPTRSPAYFKNLSMESCCYKLIKRELGLGASYSSKKDDRYGLSRNCTNVFLEKETKIPAGHEFIAIYCKFKRTVIRKSPKREPWGPGKTNFRTYTTYITHEEKLVDMMSFVHLKPEVEKRLEGLNMTRKRMNVLILGIDSLSHMNFVRTFPKSQDFLEKMGALEMNWYNKIGDNTFPNIIPMLTGKPARDISGSCARSKTFDHCPMIWKEFSKKGYRTALIEDSPSISIFNHLMGGFTKPPTDYYLRPFALAVERDMATYRRRFTTLCQGPRLGFANLLDYTKKFVKTMGQNGKNFFYFLWATSLTHDSLNDGFWGDPHLLRTLQWLHGHLNDTILILMSDHGRRFGEIRAYLQGQLEDRLPLLYFVLPQKLKENYPSAYWNLWGNQDSLVTTHDLYETLMDILNSEDKLKNEDVTLRSDPKKRNPLPRGISLFLPVPSDRTCKQAAIPDNFCACNKMIPVNINQSEVKVAAKIALENMNTLISKREECSPLKLKRIVSALKVGSQFRKWEAYQLNYITVPGNGSFEALVGRETNKLWHVSGSIERTNMYGNQSSCVDDIKLKYYCYCRNLTNSV